MNETTNINAVAVREHNTAVGEALGVNEILAQVRLIQEVMAKVMKEKEHYGTIPGCGDKKTLLQPGAQKLTMTFRLAPEYDIQEVNLPRDHKEYRVTCTLKSIHSGSFVGQGVGCCSTMETKYRWRQGEGESTGQPVPKSYWTARDTTLIGGKEFTTRKIDGQWVICKKGEKVENDNPADCYNTVLKMAKKRAFVDATITATAASDIFTQDLESDEHAEDDTGTLPRQPEAPLSSSAPASPITPADQSAADLKLFHGELSKRIKGVEDNFLTFLRQSGELQANQGLDSLPLAKLKAYVNSWPSIKSAFEKWLDTPPDEESESFETASAEAPRSGQSHTPAESAVSEEWRKVIVPIPRKGQKRDEYLKSPDTIGSLYDASPTDEEARKRLFGFVEYFEPKGWTKRDGTPMPPSEADKLFRRALDDFKAWEQAKRGELKGAA